MNTAPLVLGNHAFFFRDGDSYSSPTSGTAGRSSKPGPNDSAWIDLGVLSKVDVEAASTDVEIFQPSPGQLRLYDVIETKRQLNITIGCEELGALAFEHIFGTLALGTASTQYNPLEGATKKGWLKIQQYGQDDAIVNTVDVYVHFKVGGAVSFADSNVKTEFKARVLHSTLNTGTLVAS